MITGWEIYLFTRVDTLISIFQNMIPLPVVLTIPCAIGLIVMAVDREVAEENPFLKKLALRGLVGAVTFFFLLILGIAITPNQKELAAIYLLPRITSNQDVQEIPSNAMKLLNGKLKEWMGDLVEEKE